MQETNTVQTYYRYSITGKAAHSRIRPLLPSYWVDCSPYYSYHCCCEADQQPCHDKTAANRDENSVENVQNKNIDFLWENAPRLETKSIRDSTLCYSHLPHGIEILDDKWVLSRLFTDYLMRGGYDDSSSSSHGPWDRASVLQTFCFRGREGLHALYQRLNENSNSTMQQVNRPQEHRMAFIDLDPQYRPQSFDLECITHGSSQPSNIWVIKDANANGFGGVWIMNMDLPLSHQILLDETKSPLKNDQCRYVAQEYAWPPVLYQRRKCHVRVYAVVMSGRAYIHKRCFLHVANKEFVMDSSVLSDGSRHDTSNSRESQSSCLDCDSFDPAVHITNCCANSHDPEAFKGEILADLQLAPGDGDEIREDGQKVIPLKDYYPSIAASVEVLVTNAMQYVQGGEKNHGFEYLGLDFILSHDNGKPVAYLLEVNCPPSQDTATGLKHAEELHNEVLKDLMDMWVIPCVEFGQANLKAKVGEREGPFGWCCVYKEKKVPQLVTNHECIIEPSKAAILNMIRWGMFERRMKKNDEQKMSLPLSNVNSELEQRSPSAEEISTFARSQFPYFEADSKRKSRNIFLENAGGSQVPFQVINRMVESLSHRHRSVIGQKSKEEARKVTMTLLGGSFEKHRVFFGPNASTLFESLANLYVRSGFLRRDDNIILASENHSAHVTPWIDAATKTGSHVCWWTRNHLPFIQGCNASTDIQKLLCPQTRLVCLSHSSNVLGSIRDIRAICNHIREICPRAHVVVDGVAAAPHIFPAVDDLGVDWYCVSFHKIFGPHMGAIVGKVSAFNDLYCEGETDAEETKLIECGTLNYEACNGLVGLGQYFSALATFDSGIIMKKNAERSGDDPMQCRDSLVTDLSKDLILRAYERVKIVEMKCLDAVKSYLTRNRLVRVLADESHDLPIISFVHKNIPSKVIVDHCDHHRISIRCGSFLMTKLYQTELNVEQGCGDEEGGVVRASFCHYNTLEEAEMFIAVLNNIQGWDKPI